ncbi:chemotaxis protein CheW [Endothiovibrio diazotrophicus]
MSRNPTTEQREGRGTLVEQQLALGVYLEALLRDPQLEQRVEAPAPAAPATAPALETPVAPPAPVVSQVAAAVEAVRRSEAGVPDWAANTSFQCLLFKVWGLTLSVPLVKLYGVLTWPESLTPVFGHADWFMGLVRSQDKNIQVMDTAQLVLPPHKLESLRADQERQFRNIILIDEGRCGLACDEVAQVITLREGDVQWRSAEGKRPWLAGTVREHMCALLEVDEFIRMIRAIKSDADLEAFNE